MGATVSRCDEAESAQGPEVTMAGTHVARKGDERIPYYKSDDSEAEQNDGEGASAPDAEEAEDDSGEEHRPQVEVATTPYDIRFPGINQARACYTRYNEFHKCKAQKDETDPECTFYAKAYRSLCPGEWVETWNEQREAGSWYGKY